VKCADKKFVVFGWLSQSKSCLSCFIIPTSSWNSRFR
jgi:hypothetical protein